MKTKIIYVFFIFFSVLLFSQEQKKVVIAPTKMNIVYIGVDNFIDIVVPEMNTDEVMAISVGASMLYVEKCKYNVRVSGGTEVEIRVSANKKCISIHHFKVKKVPDPIVEIGEKTGGIISKGELLLQATITARKPDFFDFDCDFQIVQFTFKTEVNGELVSYKTTNGQFSDEMKKIICELQSGDIAIFDDITVLVCSGETRVIEPLVFVIE
ncbi:MAG: hypothetical protein A2W91_14575 [Bacteroidetes bacterium GWF2_38_335]|nr:MAG: hypothetical protein A2W91_14575 [Bacteroidetes bacterium GWF2_38_335]OFY79317.1 MAG: hypothetical protein A2281_16580 [Bacteroidetes bacterium RIFOXYA12_FULL_38_20]HBS85574.1 hypothetical protein [Bacteroidales bacterium]